MSPATATLWRWRRFAVLFMALWAVLSMLGGCSSLPRGVERPVSHALAAPENTPLGALVQQRRAEAGAKHGSGFTLLSGPQAAYGSRLALVEAAQQTLDLQYYAIHADASSERLLLGVVAAARRGVRVRVLLDDFHSTGRNAQVMRLAFEPNIEMRMFNPLTGARGSVLGRAISALADFDRVQQRMHNKLFIADNMAGVAGGRNLGDAYFGNAESGNFVDLDVLAVGPIVQELSRSFDSYWNDQRAYPVQSLITREELDRLRAQTPSVEPLPVSTAPGLIDPEALTTQRARAWDHKPLDLASARFVWAPAVVMADHPEKIPSENGPPPPAEAAASVVDGLLTLIGQARRDLLIVSPYFVPGPDMKAAFAAARARGVRVQVLTNSLASNDAPLAHAGYARHREDLLAMGVELYELRSEQAGLRSAIGSAAGGSTGSSRAMLHTKLLLVDGRIVVVGSMNIDPRSQKHNTEIALLIVSTELARRTATRIDPAMQERAWRVERTDDGLVWRAPRGSGLDDATSEPDASLPLRLMLKLLGPLAPDHLL
ncbi:phospholipase D-like domain-containing protein [Paenacidovorax monticola]|uniref:Phospholipase D family protein n=1 Tax=Paenacidovorax monticola TaxID=1926868 RepID=A0A7H0HK40_9BURK|nr:phospholipase D family protein [Paenacidovorax monticola]